MICGYGGSRDSRGCSCVRGTSLLLMLESVFLPVSSCPEVGVPSETGSHVVWPAPRHLRRIEAGPARTKNEGQNVRLD